MGRSPWGSVRKLPSGRFQARYRIDLGWHSAPTTFRTKQLALAGIGASGHGLSHRIDEMLADGFGRD